MNKKYVVWQRLLDKEMLRLSSLPVEDLCSMDVSTPGVIHEGELTIKYGIWHEVHSEDAEYSSQEEAGSLSAQLERNFGIRRPQWETHSFVLKAGRSLFLGFYRTYLAGFSLDEEGNVTTISDEILYAYD